MKRTIILTVFALIISAGINAQDTKQDPTRTRTRTRSGEQVTTQDQEKVQAPNDASAHGQTVSSTAKTTESGQGKGEIVSQAASSKSKSEKTAKEKTGAKNISAKNTGAKGGAARPGAKPAPAPKTGKR